MADMVIDPVCKMLVDPDNAPARSDYNGIAYYFCAAGCKHAFDENPQKYLTNAPGLSHSAPAAAATPSSPPEPKRSWWQFWKS